MKFLTLAGILVANLVLQSAVFPHLRVFGVKPDSLLVIVVSYALINGSLGGAILGLFGGLLQDILFSKYIGLYALQYMLVGYMVGMVYQKVYIDRVFLPVLFTIGSYAIKEILMFVLVFFIGHDINLPITLLGIIIPGALYTGLLMPIVHYGMSQLHKRKYMNKRWRIGSP